MYDVIQPLMIRPSRPTIPPFPTPSPGSCSSDVEHTLTEDTRAATEADKVDPFTDGIVFILAGATNPLNAPTRGAEVAEVRPALAATRAELAVMEAATILN